MHYNIQINVQQVGVQRDANVPLRRTSSQTTQPPRRVTVEVLSLKVVARTEQDAYAKAALMLKAATPEPDENAEPIEGSANDEEDEDGF